MSRKNPLQSFAGVVRFLWAATTVGFLAGAAFKAQASFGVGTLCFTSGVTAGRFDADDQGMVRGGTSTSPTELRYCLAEPTTGDRLLGVLDGPLGWFVYAVLFYLLLRLLERAKGEGLNTAGTAARLRRFGWFTLVAVPVATLLEAIVRTSLLSHAVTYELSAAAFLSDWSLPWWALVAGLGVLSLGKLTRSSQDGLLSHRPA